MKRDEKLELIKIKAMSIGSMIQEYQEQDRHMIGDYTGLLNDVESDMFYLKKWINDAWDKC